MAGIGSMISVPYHTGTQSNMGLVVSSRPMGGDESLQSVTVKPYGKASESAAAGNTQPTGQVDLNARSPQTSLIEAFSLGALLRYGQETQGTIAPTSEEGAQSASEQAALNRLRQAHSAVVQEELAHAANAGAFAGPPIYQYAVGPDGQRYAVGGSVGVKTSNPSGDPEQAARNAAKVQAAALAPNNPSGQDMIVARSSAAALAQSRIAANSAEETTGVDFTV